METIDAAADALDAALARLERAVDDALARLDAASVANGEVDALVADRARLAEALDASMAREKELQALADEASAALGSAIDEVRAALNRDD